MRGYTILDDLLIPCFRLINVCIRCLDWTRTLSLLMENQIMFLIQHLYRCRIQTLLRLQCISQNWEPLASMVYQ